MNKAFKNYQPLKGYTEQPIDPALAGYANLLASVVRQMVKMPLDENLRKMRIKMCTLNIEWELLRHVCDVFNLDYDKVKIKILKSNTKNLCEYQ